MLTQRRAWRALLALGQEQDSQRMPADFQMGSLSISLGLARPSQTQWKALLAFAKEQDVIGQFAAMQRGEHVNTSENRPALHMALRDFSDTPLNVDGRNLSAEITETRAQMQYLSEQIRQGHWRGFSGKPIKHLIHIGMGGSDLGPRLCINALQAQCEIAFSCHFVSDADPNALASAVRGLSAEECLFIVVSKTFTTPETLANAAKAKAWLNEHGAQSIDNHFIAITAYPERAKAQNYTHVLPIWESIGGRFSISSSVNLISAIALGYSSFEAFLHGMQAMDKHVLHSPLEDNLPILLALLGIWDINVHGLYQHIVLCFGQDLNLLVPYLQQLDMESNGKSTNRVGKPIDYATGPSLFGGPGNQGQHSYFQHIAQGQSPSSLDFIGIATQSDSLMHTSMNAMFEALNASMKPDSPASSRILGPKPSRKILLDSLTPYNLGMLIALYEHKVVAQGFLWEINSFDQPGVETMKQYFRHGKNL